MDQTNHIEPPQWRDSVVKKPKMDQEGVSVLERIIGQQADSGLPTATLQRRRSSSVQSLVCLYSDL